MKRYNQFGEEDPAGRYDSFNELIPTPPGPSADSLNSLQQRAMRFGYSALPSSDQALLDSAFKSSMAAKSGLSWEEVKRRMDAAAGRFASPDIRERVAAAQTAAGLDSAAASPMVREAESELAGLPAYQAADVRGGAYLERGEVPSSLEAILPRFAEYGRRGAGFWDKARGAAGDVLSAPGRMALAEVTLPLNAFLNADFSDINLQNAADWAELPGRTWEGIKKAVTDMPAVMMATDNPVADPATAIGMVGGPLGGRALSAAGKVAESQIPTLLARYASLPAWAKDAVAGGAIGASTSGITSALEGRESPGREALFGGVADALITPIAGGMARRYADAPNEAVKAFPRYGDLAQRERKEAFKLVDNDLPFTKEDLSEWLLGLPRGTKGRADVLDELAIKRTEKAREAYKEATAAAEADVEAGRYVPAMYYSRLTPKGFDEPLRFGSKTKQPETITQRALRNIYRADIDMHKQYPADIPGKAAELAEKEILPRLTAYSRGTLDEFLRTGELPEGLSSIAAREAGMPMDNRMLDFYPEPGEEGGIENYRELLNSMRAYPADYPVHAGKMNKSKRVVAASKISRERALDEAVKDALLQDQLRSPGFMSIIRPGGVDKAGPAEIEYATAKGLERFLGNTRDAGIATREFKPRWGALTTHVYKPKMSTYEEALKNIQAAQGIAERTRAMRAILPYAVPTLTPLTEEPDVSRTGGLLGRLRSMTK